MPSESLTDPVPEPQADPQPGGWFRALSRRVLRIGLAKSTLLLTLLVWMLAVVLAQAFIGVMGRGDRLVAMVSSTAISLLLTPLLGVVLLRLVFELERTRQRLGLLATTDGLTGIHNRRHFMQLAQREWERARRYDTDAALLMIDVDHFKQVNDAHGHLCGDELLRQLAKAAGRTLRQPDLLGRFGGEELVVFLPHADPLGALDAAERIRRQVQGMSMAWQGATVSVTVSIGVAPLRAELPTFDWMIQEADTALYAAKADGRNCVRTLPFQPRRSGEAYPVNSK